ncbi:DUF2934 domain-containing protein [Rhizobium sp. S152]|uniref:DUF2934 domain-containing protein n=1 Tax=Rhizobium sp. S152 TaxID=3055038 RepID=UPI0025AA1D92|nr:DUF2934 domain-containing protein [Rhizobium sp. S152]MDM9625454.1 DUF2934 domain-containing protein [Rhizobium sp. S152]
MFRSKDDWINQRAYALWEAEGRPEGRSGQHWQQAALEYEQLERTRASSDGSDLIDRLRAMGRLARAGDGNASTPAETTDAMAARRSAS